MGTSVIHDRTQEEKILQGAFDVIAAAFAQDADLSSAQLNALPAAVQAILGFEPKVAPAA
jgi:hypothetical protein